MQKKWLTLLALPVAAGLATMLAAGAPQRDGARLLDQVMARLQREAIDSISQDEIYERAARGLVPAGPVDYGKLMPATYVVLIVLVGFMVLTNFVDLVNPIRPFQ